MILELKQKGSMKNLKNNPQQLRKQSQQQKEKLPKKKHFQYKRSRKSKM